MPSFPIQNIPSDTTMLDFRSTVEKFGAAAKSCRFIVRILPTTPGHFLTAAGYTSLLQDFSYLCEAIEYPGRGFDFVETRYYGPSQMTPYNSKYSNEFSVSILTRQEAFERQMFDDWLEIINPTNTFDLNYPDTYRCRIEIYQLAEVPAGTDDNSKYKSKASYLWQLNDAWPIQVNPQQVTWADNDILRLNVTFAYRYWSRPGRDVVPRTSTNFA